MAPSVRARVVPHELRDCGIHGPLGGGMGHVGLESILPLLGWATMETSGASRALRRAFMQFESVGGPHQPLAANAT
jgi:hypothetical protein